MVQCRVDAQRVCPEPPERWDDKQWMEYQANRFASSFLMPRSAVQKIASGCAYLPQPFRYEAMVRMVRDSLDVSAQAATYRLKDLGYIPKDYKVLINANHVKVFPCYDYPLASA